MSSFCDDETYTAPTLARDVGGNLFAAEEDAVEGLVDEDFSLVLDARGLVLIEVRCRPACNDFDLEVPRP